MSSKLLGLGVLSIIIELICLSLTNRMTTIAALMRNLGAHSSLADITLIRNFISVHHLLPLPPDAIVTPVRFEVKKREDEEGLRGFLA